MSVDLQVVAGYGFILEEADVSRIAAALGDEDELETYGAAEYVDLVLQRDIRDLATKFSYASTSSWGYGSPMRLLVGPSRLILSAWDADQLVSVPAGDLLVTTEELDDTLDLMRRFGLDDSLGLHFYVAGYYS